MSRANQFVRVIRCVCLLSVVAVAACGMSRAWAGAAPSAKDILNNMEKAMKGAKSYDMKVDITIKTTMSGNAPSPSPMGNNVAMSMRIAMVKPNKMLMQQTSQMPGAGVTIVSNGKSLWTYNPMLNQYTEKPAPKDISSLTSGNSVMPTQDVTKNAKSAKVVGSAKVGNVDTYVIEAVVAASQGPRGMPIGSEGIPFKFWIGKQDYMMRKFEANVKMSAPQAPGGGGNPPQSMNVSMAISGSVNDLKLNTPLPDSLFSFKPPTGAKKVDRFQMPQMGGPPGAGAPRMAPGAPGRR